LRNFKDYARIAARHFDTLKATHCIFSTYAIHPQEVVFMKKWNKPVIREICVGCEINSYYSGDF